MELRLPYGLDFFSVIFMCQTVLHELICTSMYSRGEEITLYIWAVHTVDISNWMETLFPFPPVGGACWGGVMVCKCALLVVVFRSGIQLNLTKRTKV